MNKTIKFIVEKKDHNIRVDLILSEKINFITRTYVKKLIENSQLKINKKIVKTPATKVKVNDKIIINIIEKKESKVLPKKMDLKIVFEDNDIIVLDKPKGLVVHPGVGNFENTLVNALKYRYKDNLSSINGKIRPGIVHRIDKDTSGLLVIAKNNFSHSNLSKQFSDHSIKRNYHCLIWGVIRPLIGKVETLICRSQKNRQLMTVSEIRGKKAITNYKTLKVFNIKEVPKISLIECQLETGRTHQIRVHLKHKGTSIIGDQQYGKKNIKFKKINKDFFNILSNIAGQVLHAQTLGFSHPIKKKWMSFKAPLPNDFKKMLNFLNKHTG
ncbi:RluA family pseudouridine synthase [Candidatus Pelagibacter communis]|uniref:RluA family pseudouridine synthase n=1 Tax=Pelagibacter ubique TaxID=198252 RepID=UPI00094DE34D|nr:RluA family pseudouridine synthase [Candidatus Pelagibacter ubique]